jgi:hypothetical protein
LVLSTLACMFNLVSMQSVYIFYGILFRVMDSALHLSGWKAIYHFCSQFGIFYVLTTHCRFYREHQWTPHLLRPALGGIPPKSKRKKYQTGNKNGKWPSTLINVTRYPMFLRRNPSVLFAFVVILFIWLSHLRSDCIVTSRYLA